MNTKPRHRWRSAAALTTTLSLATLGVVLTGTAAQAAAIDPDATGSITVHKHENPGGGAQNPDGTGTDPTTDAIEGVTFEVCQIDGVDLTDGTNAGWNALGAITPSELSAAQSGAALGSFGLIDCVDDVTDIDGEVLFDDLDVAAYLVRETATPAGVIAGSPFLVTVPTPHATDDDVWVYDVNVYPKNTVVDGPRKNIVNQDDQSTNGVKLGDAITYQVTTKIPGLPAGEDYTKFSLTDTLDDRLDPNTDLGTVAVTVFGGPTFAQGTDYTAAWSGQTLTVTFLQAGLDQLVAGQNIVVEFEAAVSAIGAIDNQAYVNVNDLDLDGDGEPGTPGEPTNIVQTRWGSLVAEKVDSANASLALGGAEFEVWMSPTKEDDSCVADTDLIQVLDGTDPYTVVSAADGSITVPGLWVGDTELVVDADGSVTDVNESGHDLDSRCYVLVEVKAPAGYVLPTGDDAKTAVQINTGVNGPVDGLAYLTITNAQQVVPGLPLTGANGQLLMMWAGIALVTIAAGSVLIAVRRRAIEHG